MWHPVTHQTVDFTFVSKETCPCSTATILDSNVKRPCIPKKNPKKTKPTK